MWAFRTNQGELTSCKHHPKYIQGSKDHDHLLRHFKLLLWWENNGSKTLLSFPLESAWEESLVPKASEAQWGVK